MLDAQLWQFPDSLRALIEAELGDDEQITWIGAPRARQFAWNAMPAVIFGIPWTAFAIFWTAGAAGYKLPDFQEGDDFFPLFGIPLVLVGFGMLISPYWWIRKARRTAYILTNKRAIIFEGGFLGTMIRTFGPDHLTDLRRVQRSDGSGDLILERKLSHSNDSADMSTDRGFLAIPNVKAVEDLVRQLVESSSNR